LLYLQLEVLKRSPDAVTGHDRTQLAGLQTGAESREAAAATSKLGQIFLAGTGALWL